MTSQPRLCRCAPSVSLLDHVRQKTHIRRRSYRDNERRRNSGASGWCLFGPANTRIGDVMPGDEKRNASQNPAFSGGESSPSDAFRLPAGDARLNSVLCHTRTKPVHTDGDKLCRVVVDIELRIDLAEIRTGKARGIFYLRDKCTRPCVPTSFVLIILPPESDPSDA